MELPEYNEIVPTDEAALPSILYNKLKKGEHKSALKILKKNKYKNYITNNSLDIVPIISRILEEDFCTLDTEKCIEQLLVYIARVANSKEALLVFLEEIEIFRSEKQFRVFLKPLQTILLKQISGNARSSSFSWVFKSLYSHVSMLPLPFNYNLENKERKLLECDPIIQNFTEILESLIQFYSEFYLKLQSGNLSWQEKGDSKEYFSLFLLQYFHKPLSYLDIYCENEEMCSSIYQSTKRLVDMIVHLLCNPFKLLNYIKPLNSTKIAENNQKGSINAIEYDCDGENETDSISQLSIACFFYCIIGQNMSASFVPCVYSTEYLYLSCLPSCAYLLNEKNDLAIHKGLLLLKSFLNQLSNEFLSITSLEAPNHLDVVKSLVNVMIFCDNKELRIMSLTQFKIVLWKFKGPGRIRLINTVLSTVKHPGVLSVVIHEIKENIAKSMSNIQDLDCSLDKADLKNALELACSLPEGEKTDMLEWSDKIMASLNLILFLCLRDKQNVTKYKDLLPKFCAEFMEPLRRGLVISKGHYELKLKDLKDTNSKSLESIHISFNGDTGLCPNLPPQQERQVVETALNWLDIMQSVWARVDKLISVQ